MRDLDGGDDGVDAQLVKVVAPGRKVNNSVARAKRRVKGMQTEGINLREGDCLRGTESEKGWLSW